jgi:hypothetical protein
MQDYLLMRKQLENQKRCNKELVLELYP